MDRDGFQLVSRAVRNPTSLVAHTVVRNSFEALKQVNEEVEPGVGEMNSNQVSGEKNLSSSNG